MRNSSARLKNMVSTAAIALGVWALSNPALSSQLEYDREIHLKGTTNTRDIGGYTTSDLRTIRPGQIIRSENLSRLTEADFQKLEEIGVKTVIDLRTDKEHEKKPTVWLGDNPPQFYHFPVGDADDAWFKAQRSLIKRNKFSARDSQELMVDGYRTIAEDGVSSYEQVMKVVLDQSNWPVLIHCNAGKDRAGIATTLILEAIGVDRETIMEEYLLTNEIGRSKEKAELMAKESSKSRRISRGPSADAWYPIVGVQPEMLEAYYTTVETQYGSMDAFLNELGVDQDARAALAESLTAEPQELVMGE